MNTSRVTETEQTYPDHVRLISTTDTRGIITYANPEFCKIAGFSLDELIGKQHSIVRHPDMPAAAFQDMWEHLNTDTPWMGMVKNRCKNGDYYWVQAYVMPTYDSHNVKTGYQSVRTRPSKEQIDRAEAVYKQLRNKPAQPVKASSLASKITTYFVAMGIGSISINTLPISQPYQSITMLALFGIVLLLLIKSIRNLKKISSVTEQIYNNPLAQKVMSENMHEQGAVDLATRMMRAKLRTVIGRVEDSISTLGDVMKETDEAISQTTTGINQQNSESDMLASAATQMSSTAHEIAQNTAQTSEVTKKASDLAHTGKQNIDVMLESIAALASDVETASSSSDELKKQATSIEQIINIINEIAEQTNLLALNAAIEAARAGDQGRGFAVVADEVRTLAQRTQTSTSEIRGTIEAIQKQVSVTADSMSRCSIQANKGIHLAQDASQSFDAVSDAMSEISDRTIQVASASEQQSAVSEEISNNILSIRNIASDNMSAAEKTNHASNNLHKLVAELQSMMKNFSA